jgi:hypothetical protein
MALDAERLADGLERFIAAAFDPAGITFAIIGGEPLIRDDIEAVGAMPLGWASAGASPPTACCCRPAGWPR